ncbi:MAG TPA: ECF-type sigma factor [Bryobacteraceae bacterium]|nr:ECF-type sigma factor [Bryobacteraceae bacterium]
MQEPTGPGEVTVLLERIQGGDRRAVSDLATLAFPELRRLAAACLRNSAPGHTWFPTDLVNELWVRLLRRERIDYQNRAHFLGAAAHLMRALVVDHARMRAAGKRSPSVGGWLADAFDPHLEFSEAEAAELVALAEALDRLAAMSERQAKIVEMRYFAGFTVEETADAMGLSPTTVKREWAAARAWLHGELRAPG